MTTKWYAEHMCQFFLEGVQRIDEKHGFTGNIPPEQDRKTFFKWFYGELAKAWEEGKEDTLRGLDIHGDTNAENPYVSESFPK